MRSFVPDEWEPDDVEVAVDVPSLEVEITDPEVVGVILGPDGEPLHTVLSRERFPFGFNLA